MKAHIGVDKDNGLTHAIETATKIHDPTPAADLLQGLETKVSIHSA